MNASVFDEFEFLTNQIARYHRGESLDIEAGELLARATALGLKMIEGKIAAISEEDLMALNRLFWDAEKEERQAPMPGQYWQGKKDGLRAALALLDKKTGIDWAAFQDSSRAGQASELEILRAMMKEALRTAQLVAIGEWPDAIDAKNFLAWYKRVQDRVHIT